ncbi:hypothetical protein VPH35_009453 [Triticum aestivum]
MAVATCRPSGRPNHPTKRPGAPPPNPSPVSSPPMLVPLFFFMPEMPLAAPSLLTRPPAAPRRTTVSRRTDIVAYAIYNTDSTPGSPTMTGSRPSSTSVPPPSVVRSAPPRVPSAFPSLPELRYTQTDAAATQYDYGVDDPSLPEQSDAGAQEPDATVDDDSYYTGGVYYYMQPAHDDQE